MNNNNKVILIYKYNLSYFNLNQGYLILKNK